MFRVGQRVVCVDDGGWSHRFLRGDIRRPVKNAIYIVRDAFPSWDDGRPSVLLEEIRNGIHRQSGLEYGFFASRFRPLIERKTDISFAHEILRKASKKKPAPAFSIHQAWHG